MGAAIASDSSDNDDSDSEYDVKKKKVKKKSDKSNNGNKKSPTKVKIKKTPRAKVTNTDAEDASDEEGAIVAKQYRKLQKKIMKGKSQAYQDKKSNRLTERKKYAE